MALTANQLKKQVDLPTWEWLRFSPVAPGAGVSCSCSADNSQFNENSGRYIYYMLNATNFWRYDTITDTYEQLASPPQAPILPATSMRFAGAQGYYNRVISATSTSFTTGLPFGSAAVGYKVRIVSGKGAGQERVITKVDDPIVADFGGATAGTTTSLTDAAKTWTTGYTGAVLNVNKWVGYVVRTLFGAGANQVRKILYNSATVLTTGDINFVQNDPFANNTMVTSAAGTVYQIESSVVTIDTAWNDTPDVTSRFVIQSGGIWLISSAAAAPFYTLQYYDVLHDMWYAKPALTNMIVAGPSDVSVERMTENSTLWQQSIATSGSVTTLVDSTLNWVVNAYANYKLYIYSGTGEGQIVTITSNTANTLTFPTLGVAPDATSRYQITGYDAGTSSGSALYNTLPDTTKAWAVDRWANYGVRILFGAGAGQLRRIASNTTDTLTIIGSWNEMPSNTSVYAIIGATETMFVGWGGSGEVFMHNAGNLDMLTHGRILDSGIACIAAALLCDSNHMIYEAMPYAITTLAGTTTITATTTQAHNLKVGQYVSIRGVTTAGADQYNITGLMQIASVPSTTTFTYVPTVAGSGAVYTYLTAQGTGNLSDASKDFRELAASGTNTSITFTKVTPSNINGWYVTGTNVTPGTTVTSGAGTNTVNLSGGAAIPSGTIIFSPWGPSTAITSTFSSGGGTGIATVTMTANTNANINGWYVSGTGIAIGSTVTSGAGTTAIVLSTACTGSVSGTITFYPPRVAGNQIVMTTGAPAASTGLTAGQLMMSASSGVGGGTIGFLAALALAPVAGLTRYAITKKELLGAALDQSTTTYNAGIATGGSTTTLIDTSAFWATATGSGSAQGTTIVLNNPSPGNVNGWYVTGAGINVGAKIISGAGTNTITVDVPHSATVSGVITCAAWNTSLIGRRIKVQSGATGLNQELIITAVAPTTGTLTFATAVAPLANVGVYSLLSIPVKGAGHELSWVSSNSNLDTRGKYLWMPRCGATVGIDKLDLNTDKVVIPYLIPYAEVLGAGSSFAYDGIDRIYFTKDVTQRIYYVDVNTNWIHGAGLFPYNAGTAGVGNKMEIFTTTDGLNYLWINRQQAQEHFRCLLFF